MSPSKFLKSAPHAKSLATVTHPTLLNDQEAASTLLDYVYWEGTGGRDSYIAPNRQNNYLDGKGGDDSLYGGNLDDILIGGTGIDTLNGSDGNDIFYVDSPEDVVLDSSGFEKVIVFGSGYTLKRPGIEVLELSQETLIDTASLYVRDDFGSYANKLIGNDADNILDGGELGDTLQGGKGNDRYYVDTQDDLVTELDGEGSQDKIETKVSYSLAAGSSVEIVELKSTAAANLIGNEFSNRLVGNDKENFLDGGAGADFLQGGNGADRYIVDDEADRVSEFGTDGASDEVFANTHFTLGVGVLVENLYAFNGSGMRLTGNEKSNRIVGHLGNDTIDGGSGGADSLEGDVGDDVYYVRSNLQVVKEYEGKGNDTVETSIFYELTDHVENLQAMGTGAITLTGNGLSNVIVGNGAANMLRGKGGDDLVKGGDGIDTVFFSGNRANYAVTKNENGSLLIADKTANRDGEDTVLEVERFAFADGTVDLNTLLETPAPIPSDPSTPGNQESPTGGSGGSSPPPVRDLMLMGTKKVDRLIGGLGNDKIFGKLGSDVLVGGAGKDIFVLDAKPGKANIDWLTDFNVKDDTIWLDNKYFKIGKGTPSKPVQLSKKMFWTGAKAHDKDDRIIFDKAKGALLYDADGSGTGAAVQIAKLPRGLKGFSEKDLFVI